MNHLDWALLYASKGWPVFPLHQPVNGGCSCGNRKCGSPGKHPRTANGFHDATTDEAQIRTWWTCWPDANIGGRTGVVFDVIDLDGREGIESFMDFCHQHEIDPNSFLRSSTGREDGGRHLFIPATGRGNNAVALPHVDYRGAGGYAVLPPSLHASGARYAWKVEPNGSIPEAPAPILDLLLALAGPDIDYDPAGMVFRSEGGSTPWGRAALEGELKNLQTAPKGHRNHTLNRAAYKAFQVVAGGYLDETEVVVSMRAVALRAGLSETEVDKTINSARKGLEFPRGPKEKPKTSTGRVGALNGRHKAKESETEPAEPAQPYGVSLADVQPEAIEWLWKGRIPLGKLTIIDGHPGLGKSALHMDIAARVSCGREMPDGSSGMVGNVLLLAAEDGIADTIRPRMMAAGADCTRIRVMGDDDVPLIPDDLERIERAVTEFSARLLIIDPLFAYVNASAAKSISDQEMRQKAMTPLKQLAQRTGCAVVLIRHLSKTQGMGAIAAGAGSMGIIGAARSSLMVGIDADNPEQRVLAPVKINIAPESASLAFRLRSHPEIDAPYVEWLGTSELTAEHLMAKPPSDEERGALAEAKDFLRDRLGDLMPHRAAEIEDAAKAQHIALRTLRRARQSLGINVRKLAGASSGPWVWQLPAKSSEDQNR